MNDNPGKSRGRYWLIGILFFHTVNTYMDRACISSASGAMQKDLGFNDQMLGYIFGMFAIGSAFSAIIFPYFLANVTLPYFTEQTGTANSFFVFAATINVLAAVAWLFMNPKKTISDSITPAQARIRLVLFIIAAVVLVGGLLTYKIFFMK